MFILDLIAERKIAEATERGELSNLPGEGQPLQLDDDGMVPEDLRMAYRILKNAGLVPPEVELLRELRELEALVAREGTTDGSSRAARKLELLRLRLATCGCGTDALHPKGAYFAAIAARFGQSG